MKGVEQRERKREREKIVQALWPATKVCTSANAAEKVENQFHEINFI